MSKFKEIATKDMENVFFNNEFSDIHTINETEVKCIIDNDILEELKAKKTNGIIEGNILIYIYNKELAKTEIIPRTDMLIEFDKKMYFIESVEVDSDLYTLILKANYD